MRLIRGRVVIVIALSIIVFTCTAAILSALQNGPRAFAGDAALVISSSGAPTIFSSQIDNGMVSALDSAASQFDAQLSASPEIFAFCSYGDESFVVRGVNYTRFDSVGPKFLDFEVADNESQYDRGSAVIGLELMRRLGVEPPFTMPLVGSYSTRMDLVTVVGWFRTDTTVDNELFVNLERARFLSGMRADKISIIRINSENPDQVRELLAPNEPRFTLYDLHTSKSILSAGETITLNVTVRNWGMKPGVVQLTYNLTTSPGADGIETTLANDTVMVNASSSVAVSRKFTLSQAGEQILEVSIGGRMPVSLSANVRAVDPYMTYWGPRKVMLGDAFNVTALRYDGYPVEGATIDFLGQTVSTDAQGMVVLVADSLGNQTLSGSAGGLSGFNVTIEVSDPAAFPDGFLPLVTGLSLSADTIKESESVLGIVQLVNGGTVGGSFDLPVYVDFPSGQLMLYNVSLGPLESKQFTFPLEDLSVGTHYVGVELFSASLVVEPWYATEPDFVELFVRYGGMNQLSSAGSIPIYQAAKISQGNVQVALVSVGAVAALLSALAIVAIFSKEVRESRRRLGILKTLGATGHDVLRLVSPQALLRSLAGAGAGVVIGLFIADQISSSGTFMLFGHNLSIEWDEPLVLLVLVSAVLISVTSALASAWIAMRETAISAIRMLPEDEVQEGRQLETMADDFDGS